MNSSIWPSTAPYIINKGASMEVATHFKKFGCSKILVVFDEGLEKVGIPQKVMDKMKADGLECVPFNKVIADPPDYVANEAGQLALDEEVDGFLGLGGGSPMDVCKAAAIIRANEPPINNFFANPLDPPKKFKRPMCPIIVIPTTAGTGSECSPGGVITDSETGAKRAIICPVNLALVDPELTLGLPPFITATTGIDAFCHAAESLTTKTTNRAAGVLGWQACKLVFQNLEEAVTNGSNYEARENMALAASMATMSMSATGCHVPHEVGRCIGAKFHLPHGLTVAFTLVESLKYIGPYVPEKMRYLGEALQLDIPADATPEEITAIVAGAVADLYKKAKLPKITEYIKTKEELLDIVDFIIETQPFTLSPAPVDKDVVTMILSNTYDNALAEE